MSMHHRGDRPQNMCNRNSNQQFIEKLFTGKPEAFNELFLHNF